MIESSCRKIVALEFLLSALLFPLNLYISGLTFIVTFISAIFFRDPKREIQGGVISPADGKVDYVSNTRLEIFMSIFDCHVNRSPVSGRVIKVIYKPGKFHPAFMRKKDAERNEIWIKNEHGIFKVTQVAGFLARRIVCNVKEGDYVEKGQKIGMIRFGSRMIVEVPKGVKFIKKKGEKVKAGECIAVFGF